MIDPTTSADEPVTVVSPSVSAVPAFFDSPHSGSTYPADFNVTFEHQTLRRAEDAFVDELFSAAPDHGARMIAARFPRAYIDPNRSDLDIDPEQIDGWGGPAEPTEKSAVGKGLIWTRLHGKAPLYENKLTAEQVRARIDTYWRPYHGAVAQAYDDLHAEFGHVYHVDCHSMRATGNEFDPDGMVERPDFVISNHDGTSCDAAFFDLVVNHLRELGYNVAENDPYKGAELTRRYADALGGRHALQIEINRKLYMDEAAIERRGDFEDFRAHVSSLVEAVCAFAADR